MNEDDEIEEEFDEYLDWRAKQSFKQAIGTLQLL